MCSSYHVILEGDGFMAGVKRAILVGLFQLGFRQGTFFVHETPRCVTGKTQGPARTAAEALLSLATSKGLLDAGPPG